MKTLPSRAEGDFQFQSSWWDADYKPIILLTCFAGFMWILIAFTVSMIGGLDQSWYDNSPAYLLPLKIALFWPVWGTVQAERALVALGWNIGNGLFLVAVLVAILPVVSLTVLWVWLSNRRQA